MLVEYSLGSSHRDVAVVMVEKKGNANLKASKTPLVLAPCDKVDESSCFEVDNAVLQKSEVPQAVGERR